ncbi:MAG TPA: hypothetical protein VIT44_18040 [Cyclobacteriaceae bacterium]
MKFILLSLVVFTFTICAQAQDETKYRPVRLLISGAFEFGGDEVASVLFTNGETQSVNAGQGVTGSLGAQIQFLNVEKFLLRASVGYKYLTTQADNVHIRLTRVPIQLTANFMVIKKLRLSAGLVTQTGIKFNSGGLGGDMTYKSNVGPVFEIAYSGIGISFTALKYKDEDNKSYSAMLSDLHFPV